MIESGCISDDFRRIWNAYMNGLDQGPDLRPQQQQGGRGAGQHGDAGNG